MGASRRAGRGRPGRHGTAVWQGSGSRAGGPGLGRAERRCRRPLSETLKVEFKRRGRLPGSTETDKAAMRTEMAAADSAIGERHRPVVIEAQASLFLSSAPRTRHGAGSCRRATSSRAGATGEGARGKPSPGKPGAWKPRQRRVPMKPALKTGGIAANCGKKIRAGTRLSGHGTGEGRL